jgi:hypothetical protein
MNIIVYCNKKILKKDQKALQFYFHVVRLASKTTDVNWVKAKDPSAPVNYYADK